MEPPRAELSPPHLPASCRRQRSLHRQRRPTPPPGFSSKPFVGHAGSSSVIAANTVQGSDELIFNEQKESPNFSLAQCNLYRNGGNTTILKSVKVPVIQVEPTIDISSVLGDRSGEFDESREAGPYLNERAGTHSFAGPLFMFDNSIHSARECHNSWLSPGSVVWAKTALYEWWPAEVMDGRIFLESTADCSVNHVLVQFYGNHEYAWLDPVEELSEFDSFYKERSKNPSKTFQEALDQALNKDAPATPEPLPKKSSGKLKSSLHSNESCDTSSCASPGRMYDDCSTGGRGKRKRKMKVHFDDLMFSEKPTKRVRRVRIMRYLGLMAPVGSPFSAAHF